MGEQGELLDFCYWWKYARVINLALEEKTLLAASYKHLWRSVENLEHPEKLGQLELKEPKEYS